MEDCVSSMTNLLVLGSQSQNGRTISRQDAELRLRELVPGTKEHSLLEHALKIKASGIVEINLPASSYKVETFRRQELLRGGFGAAEHIAIGENINLPGLGENTPLITVGTVPIFFRHIVALAGDFYGELDRVVNGRQVYGAISLPGGQTSRKQKGLMRLLIHLLMRIGVKFRM